MSESLIKIELKPQPFNENFEALMVEAHRQQKVAMAAEELLALVRTLADHAGPLHQWVHERGISKDEFQYRSSVFYRAQGLLAKLET